jgi:two-component system phosphate regulon response regulator PhoB
MPHRSAPRSGATVARTILVVDDDEDIRSLLRAMLERGAHRVLEAADGEEALEMIARALPDLVLLDLHMPYLDGPEVCRRVKADPATRDLPVLMLTAAVQDENRRRCLDAGADGYLTKPFSPLALINLLDAHLGGAAA